MASIMRAILLFIVRGMFPLSLIDNVHFRKLVLVLDPRIVLPSRSTLTSTLLPELYEAAKSKLHEELDSCKYDGVIITPSFFYSTTTAVISTTRCFFCHPILPIKDALANGSFDLPLHW